MPTPSALEVRADRTDNNSQLQLQPHGDELHGQLDTRRYRIRGLSQNHSSRQLRVNLLVARDELLHVDTLDLYQARARRTFIKAAAAELYVDEPILKQDLGRLLLALEQLQQEQIEAATKSDVEVELSPARRETALELLRDPRLVERILADYETCGLVGEETNKLISYLACTSRGLRTPLAVLIQSSSAAGKTALMDATLAFFPDQQQIRYSALTGQSLYYMGRQDLKHKILAVAEEEGVAQASYALKLLQSDGCLRIAVAGKSQGNGRQQTESYEVEGPVMMFLTTTSPTPDEELASRCLLLHVNESRDQTAAIHERQRALYTRAQAQSHERQATIERQQDAQRLLTPLPVVIPWAEELRFRDDQTRLRRDHAKYLALIAASALLHQYQRPRRSLPATEAVDDAPLEYIEATRDDVALAGRLTAEVLGQSLAGLFPQTRLLLELLDDWVRTRCEQQQQPRSEVRFTQREVREALAWGDFQLRRHLARLVELEYVLVHRGGAGNQRSYELVYQGQGCDGSPFLLGLIDPDSLDASPPEVRNDHLEVRNDHPASRNDAHSMPLRSASDAPSMPPENGGKPKPSKPLRGASPKKRAKKVNGAR